jgi:hypothetical protein
MQKREVAKIHLYLHGPGKWKYLPRYFLRGGQHVTYRVNPNQQRGTGAFGADLG